MPVATKSKVAESQSGQVKAPMAASAEEGWEDAPSSNLPPFCIPQVGNSVTGLLISRDVDIEEKKVRGKLVKKERIYYRFTLTQESQGLNGGKTTGTLTTYPQGTIVTVPGAGALDRSFNLCALKLAGKSLDQEADPEQADY